MQLLKRYLLVRTPCSAILGFMQGCIQKGRNSWWSALALPVLSCRPCWCCQCPASARTLATLRACVFFLGWRRERWLAACAPRLPLFHVFQLEGACVRCQTIRQQQRLHVMNGPLPSLTVKCQQWELRRACQNLRSVDRQSSLSALTLPADILTSWPPLAADR